MDQSKSNPPASTGSEGHTNSNTGTSSLISSSDKEEENNLRAAYRDIGQRRMPEGTHIKKVSPKLRQTIVNGKDINLSVLLMPPAIHITAIRRKKNMILG